MSQDYLPILKQYLSSLPDLEAAYLFGSQADGSAGPGSDIDIAVLFRHGKPELYYLGKQLELSGQLSLLLKRDDVDVVVLNAAKSSELKYSVVHDGQVILDRAENLAEYELRVEHEYHDHMAALRRAGLTRG